MPPVEWEKGMPNDQYESCEIWLAKVCEWEICDCNESVGDARRDTAAPVRISDKEEDSSKTRKGNEE